MKRILNLAVLAALSMLPQLVWGQVLTEYNLNTDISRSNSIPVSFTEYQGDVYFGADFEEDRYAVYRYDASAPAGSNITLVVDMGDPVDEEGNQVVMVNDNNLLYMSTGHYVMQYDGTDTTLIAHFPNEGCKATEIIAYNNKLYFGGGHATQAGVMYEWDPAGNGGNGSLSIFNNTSTNNPWCQQDHGQSFTLHNGNLYWVQTTDGAGNELYEYDGTNITMYEVQVGANSSEIKALASTPFGLMMAANGATTGMEAYLFDGTSINLIQDMQTGFQGGLGYFASFHTFNNKVYFSGTTDEQNIGHELYEYDGSTISLVQDFAAGMWASGHPGSMTNIGDTMYFVAYTGTHSQPFRYDGSTVTQLMSVDTALSGNTSVHQMYAHNGQLYFDLKNTDTLQLYRYNPATGSNTLLATHVGDFTGSPDFWSVGQSFFGRWPTANSGMEPHVWDGSTLTLLADINTSSRSANIDNVAISNNQLYFTARDSAHGKEPMRFDGTTYYPFDLWPGSSSGAGSWLAAYNGNVYTTTQDGNPFVSAVGAELMRLQGDSAIVAADMVSGPNSSWPMEPYEFNGELYFSLLSDLWKYDGSTAQFVAEMDTSQWLGNPSNFATLNNKLYFSASTLSTSDELWEYDPATNMAQLLIDFNPNGQGRPGELTELNGVLYLRASDANFQDQLWAFDGTDTTCLSAGLGYSLNPTQLAVFDNKLFFQGRHSGVTGAELYCYDPVLDTIRMIQDMAPGHDSFEPENLTEHNGHLYMAGFTHEYGRELYRYEPVDDTIVLAADFAPGALDAKVTVFTSWNGKLWLKANARQGNNSNLWSLETCPQLSNLRERNLQDISVKLDWDPSAQATVYRIQYKQTGTSGWTNVIKNGNPATKTITGLTPTTNYRWRVAPKCNEAWGPWSEIESFRTLANPCDPITNLLVNPIAPTQARLNWGVVPNVAYYKIRWREVGGSWNVINKDAIWNKHWITGLTAGTTYEYQMKTVCPGALAGTAWTALASFTTATMKMGDGPEELLTAENSSIELRIAPNPNNGRFNLSLPAMGEPITLQIIDPIGKVVYHRQASGNQRIGEALDLSHQASGLYTVRITGNSINYTHKMLVR